MENFHRSLLKQFLRRKIQFPSEKTEAVNFTGKLIRPKAGETPFRSFSHLEIRYIYKYIWKLVFLSSGLRAILFSFTRDITASSQVSATTWLIRICLIRKLSESLGRNCHLLLLRLCATKWRLNFESLLVAWLASDLNIERVFLRSDFAGGTFA